MKAAISVYGAHLLVPEEKRSVAEIIRRSAGLGFDGIDLGYFWGEDRKREMARAKKVASDSGIAIANYICGNNFGNGAAKGELAAQIDLVKRALDEAAYFSCPCLRVFGGGYDLDWAAWSPKIVEGLAACVEYAAKVGVVMALEDHGALCKNSAQQLFYIRQVDSPYLRAMFDIGNCWTHGNERPEAAAEALADVTVMVHVKDHQVLNNTFVSVPVGEGLIDFPYCFRVLKDHGYDGYLTLEYESQIGDPKQGIAASLANIRRFAAMC